MRLHLEIFNLANKLCDFLKSQFTLLEYLYVARISPLKTGANV